MTIRTERFLLLAIVSVLLVAPVDATAQGQEKGGKKCTDGVDNDGDGLVDSDDPDCGGESDDGGGEKPPKGETDFDPAIVYARDRQGRIEVASADGQSTKVLLEVSHRGGGIEDPSWAPSEDNRIVFRGGGGLSVINADGDGHNPIPDTEGGRSPVWSPDGEWIVFTREEPDFPFESTLWLIKVRDDGGFFPPYPLNTYVGHNPTWSPDSSRIAVSAYDDTLAEYVLRVHDLNVLDTVTPSVVQTNTYRFPFGDEIASPVFSAWAKSESHAAWLAIVGPHAPGPEVGETWTDIYFVDLDNESHCAWNANQGVFDCGTGVNLTTGICCRLNNPSWSGDDLATEDVDETDMAIVVDSGGALTFPVVMADGYPVESTEIELTFIAPFSGKWNPGVDADWRRFYDSSPPE